MIKLNFKEMLIDQLIYSPFLKLCLGNRNIHELTNDGYTYLRIELMDHDCFWKYAEYSYFYVESDSNKYKLHVNGYSGDAGTLVKIILK